MLALTAGAFDPTAFVTQTRQLAILVNDYAALGLDTVSAVAWAGQGFTPDEARQWIDHGFTPDRAGHHANNFRDPEDAARRDALRQAGWCGYRN
jgi:hypothetical protein